MARPSICIEPLYPNTEDRDVLVAVHRLQTYRRGEVWPEDPQPSYDEVVRNLRTVPAFVGRQWWAAWHGDHIVGLANVSLMQTAHNRHLADCDLYVSPAYRRAGVGSSLLGEVVRRAGDDGRRLLVGRTDSDLRAGEAFARRVGGEPGMRLSISQLELDEVDRGLLRSWIEGAPIEAFELGLWNGPYPEEDLQAVITLREVMNTAPREDLDMEDFHWTPDQLRQVERALAEAGEERWTLYCRHRATSDLAGYTEVYWSPDRPELLGQGDTGVLPLYRGRGLGRWLKAAMLERVLAQRPQAERIRTGNAGSNEPMLKINRQLGFRERKVRVIWQAERQAVEQYLHARAA